MAARVALRFELRDSKDGEHASGTLLLAHEPVDGKDVPRLVAVVESNVFERLERVIRGRTGPVFFGTSVGRFDGGH